MINSNVGQHTESDLKHLFDAFDLNKDGKVHFNELMAVSCGQLSEENNGFVELAWRRINHSQAPSVTYNEVVKHFNATRHPDVMSRTKDP